MNTKSDKGFTLIEFLVVIVVVDILAAISIPIYQQYTAEVRGVEYLRALDGIQEGSVLETKTGGIRIVASFKGELVACKPILVPVSIKDDSVWRIWNPEDSLYESKYYMSTSQIAELPLLNEMRAK